MTNQDDPSGRSSGDDRRARQAEALRANLRRRKQQGRARRAGVEEEQGAASGPETLEGSGGMD